MKQWRQVIDAQEKVIHPDACGGRVVAEAVVVNGDSWGIRFTDGTAVLFTAYHGYGCPEVEHQCGSAVDRYQLRDLGLLSQEELEVILQAEEMEHGEAQKRRRRQQYEALKKEFGDE